MQLKHKTNWSKNGDESMLEYLKRILDANWIQVILAFLSLVVAFITLYYTVFKGSDEEKEIVVKVTQVDVSLRDSLINNIEVLNEAANTAEIPVNLDSLEERNIILIRNFKMLCLSIAGTWKEQLNTPVITSLTNMDVNEMMEIEHRNDVKYHNSLVELDSVLTIIHILDEVGKEHCVDAYVLNQAILSELMKLEDEIDKKSITYQNKMDALLNSMELKSDRAGKKEYNGYDKDVIKLLNIRNEFIMSKEYMYFQNKIISFLILQNNNYNIPLKKFLMGYKKEAE